MAGAFVGPTDDIYDADMDEAVAIWFDGLYMRLKRSDLAALEAQFDDDDYGYISDVITLLSYVSFRGDKETLWMTNMTCAGSAWAPRLYFSTTTQL